MQARYIDRGAPGERHLSDEFFAGIKVKEDIKHGVWIKEGYNKTIYLTVTYPMGCSYMTGQEHRATACYVSLYNGVPGYQDVKCVNGINEDNIEFNAQDCRRNIKHSNWEEKINQLLLSVKQMI